MKDSEIFYKKQYKKVLAILLLIATTMFVFFLFSIVTPSPAKRHNQFFQSYNTDPPKDIIIKGVRYTQTGENGSPIFKLEADSVSVKPMKWKFFKLMDYYHLTISRANLILYAESMKQKPSFKDVFSSIAEMLSFSAEKNAVLISLAQNRTLARTRKPARMTISPVTIKWFFPENTWIHFTASDLTLDAGSKILTMKGDVRIDSSNGVVLETQEILWLPDDGIVETVGSYTFFLGEDSEYGRDRQFRLTNARIEKGIKGPMLALARPRNPVLTAMNSFNPNKKIKDAFLFSSIFSNSKTASFAQRERRP
jgi:hypothetical protein